MEIFILIIISIILLSEAFLWFLSGFAGVKRVTLKQKLLLFSGLTIIAGVVYFSFLI